MYASKYPNGARRYTCAPTPSTDSCGGLAIVGAPTESVVVEVVLRRLDTGHLARVLAQPQEADKPAFDVAAFEARRSDLADLFAEGEITKAEWLRARDRIEKKLASARADYDRAALTLVPDDYAAPGALRDAWPDLTTDERRTILGLLVDRVVIAPAIRQGQFDAERISIEWRV